MRKILSFLTAILFAGSMMATNYELVTSASQLQAGAKYVIGTASGKFIATTSNGNNRKITDGTITENVVEGTDDMMVFTLGGEADAWTFATDNYLGAAGYLNATSSTGSNYLKVVADLDDYAYFTIAIADGVTTITCNGKASRNILYLNGTTCFACYNTQTQAQYIKPNLYKEVSDAPATGKTFYLALSADWAGWPAKYSMYYFKSENDANGFSAFMTAVPDTTNIYTGTIPDGYDKMIFVRHDGEASEPTWENKWSQTVNLDVPTNGDNLFTVVSGGTGSECNGTWSVYGEEPAPYVPTLANGFYLIGKINGVEGWTAADLSADRKFEGNPENNAEFVLTATLAEGDEIKVVNVLNDAITAWFPAQGDNYVVDANHAGEKTIYFRPDNQGGEDWFGACIYIAPNADPQPAAAVVLPATLDVTNVSFRSEGMPDFVIEEGQDYAGTYFDMGAHDSSNDTLLYAEWNVTIEPMKYNIAVDVYNINSWSVRLYLLNQTGDTVKALYYKGHSGEKGQFAIGSLDLSDLEAGDYKVRARAATAWSEMKLKDVIFTADYQGVNVDLPGTLLPAYAELSAGASIANNAIAFAPSTANNEYAIWNVIFAEAGDYNVTIDMTATNGHTYGVALLSADGESQIGVVAEAQAWDTGVKELGAITVPAAGSYKVKLTNATQWSEAVLNSITFAAPAAPALENGFYLVGNFNTWNPAAEYHLVGNPDNNAEFMVNVTLAENDQLKVVNVLDGNITAWFPAEGDNYVVDANHAGEKTIYFRPDNQGGEDWFGACIYIAPNAEPQPAEVDFTKPFTLLFNGTGESGTDNSNAYAAEVDAIFTAETKGYVASVETAERVYAGRPIADDNSSLKFGTSSAKGTLAFTLAQEIEVDSIIVNATQYSGTAAEVTVNGVKFDLTQGNKVPTDCKLTPEGKVSAITIAQTGSQRIYLRYVKVYPKQTGEEPVVEPAKFYITGDAALLGESLAWNPAAIKVTEDSYTFENLAAGDYKLKVTLDGTWGDGMVKGFSDLTTVADGLTADGDGNICFTLAEAGDVVVTYTAEAFTLAGNFYVEPQPQGCDWDNIDFLGDGSPEQTFGNQFKVCKPEGMSVVNIQKPGWAAESGIYMTFPSAAFGTISLAEGQYVIDGAGIVFYCSAFTEEYTEVTVNCEGNDIVFTVYNAKGGTPEPVANYYVIGSMTDWEVSEDYILTPNNEAEGQEFMGEFTFAANDAFKVVKNNKEVWYPDGMGNDFVISEDGDYTVYFRPNGDGGEGWHYGYIYAAKKEATAISNTAADAEAVKVLNNGMLLIRKGNKTYNVMGQAVK